MTEKNGNNLISLQDLKVHFNLGGGGFFDKITGGSPVPKIVKAVDGVSFAIEKGETLGLVGESGCGKSTLGKALLRLTPITSGKVLLSRQRSGGYVGTRTARAKEEFADDLSRPVCFAQFRG